LTVCIFWGYNDYGVEIEELRKEELIYVETGFVVGKLGLRREC